MAARIEVDLEGLDAFAGGLDRVRARLADAPQELRGSNDILGDRQVAGGLEHFEDHWRDGRAKIADGAQRLSAMVHSSVDLYRRLDAAGAAGTRAPW